MFLSVASFGCDDGYVTEDMATQATTAALPGVEWVEPVRDDVSETWRGFCKVKVEKWTEEIHTSLASAGARTRS